MTQSTAFAETLLVGVRSRLQRFQRSTQSSGEACAEIAREQQTHVSFDPGINQSISAALDWLAAAQDNSQFKDGGVARHYSLVSSWVPSYPETTGYIVPTLLQEARRRRDPKLRQRARRMLDWLVKIQMPCGGFQGGMINARRAVPVTFNTGQILMGLAEGVREFGDRYRPAMCAAADWLVNTQDSDGCWRRHPTPFAQPGEKVYETHVAWGLFEAARREPMSRYGDAGIHNVRWALTCQRPNGWFEKCCLDIPESPLTHTIGYVLRGAIEAYLFSGERRFLRAAQLTAEGALSALRPDGFLPDRLDSRWRGTVPWACLTGTAQIAHCWLLLYKETKDVRFRDAAFLANRYVRRTMRLDGPPEVRGAIKGSFPVNGGYNRFEYLNWACKFFIDSNVLEQQVREEERELTLPSHSFAVSAAS